MTAYADILMGSQKYFTYNWCSQAIFCWIIRLLYLLQHDHQYFISSEEFLFLCQQSTLDRNASKSIYTASPVLCILNLRKQQLGYFQWWKELIKLPQMSKVPSFANTYVIVLETPRTRIDLQHQAWLTEYFYAHTLSQMLSSWDFFFKLKKEREKI